MCRWARSRIEINLTEAGLTLSLPRASKRARRHGAGETGRDGGAERRAAWSWRCWRRRGLSGDDGGDEGGGGRGRERGEPARADVGARPRRPAPPRRVPRRRPRPAPRRPLRLPRRRARPDVRADHGDGLHEEGAGGELPEGGGPRAGHVRAEAGAGHGGRGGGRPQGGHLPGRRGHARRPARPRQPRPRHGQEGIAGQRQRLPLPPRVLPCSHRQAAQSAQVIGLISSMYTQRVYIINSVRLQTKCPPQKISVFCSKLRSQLCTCSSASIPINSSNVL